MLIDNDVEKYEQVAKIKVIGVGGAGNNAVNRMIEDGVQGVEFIVVNTDAQVLSISKAKHKIVLGKETSRGLGAGAEPEVGRKAAVESQSDLKAVLEGANMVFIAAGMGGGTGTGAAPVIAKIAKELGALTIAIVTKPFSFEGRKRTNSGLDGIAELKKCVDSLIIVSNDKLLQVIGNAPLKDSFREADSVLRQGVQTITDLTAIPALINLDFADISKILLGQGTALFGIGIGSGENKAIEAANKAISSPLLEASIKGAKNAIVNVTGGKEMTLFDANDAVDIVRQAARHESNVEINIIFGVAVNDHLENEMIVTVIATGFDENDVEKPNPRTIQEARLKRFGSEHEEKPLNPKPSENNGESYVNDRTMIYKPHRPIDNYALGQRNFDDDLNNDDDLPPFFRRK